MEQRVGLENQPLSTVINVQSISSFLNTDPAFIAMVDTLLVSRVIGVDFEIRTECSNGAPFRFSVLTLRLDGLPLLLEKHELAKKMVDEVNATEGRDPGVCGRLPYNLPIAATGDLTVDTSGEELDYLKRKRKAGNAEELVKMKDELEAGYAEKMKQLISENSDVLANLKQKQETRAAEELSKTKQQRAQDPELFEKFLQQHQKQNAEDFAKYKQKLQSEAAVEVAMNKSEAFNEAANAATVAMRAEFERINKIRENENAKEVAQLKKDLDAKATEEFSKLKSTLKAEVSAYLGRIEINLVAWAKEQVGFQLNDHYNKFQDLMELHKKNFQLFREKWYVDIDITGKDGDAAMQIPHAAAVKLLARNPQIFDTYKTLCIKHVIKYQRELKAQFQNHLNDIEQECMQWLGKGVCNDSRTEAWNGLKQTLNKGKGVTFNWAIKNLKSNIENVGVQIKQEDLNQEAAEIMRSFETLKKLDISKGGLAMPRVESGNLEPAIKRRVAEEAGEIMKLVDGLKPPALAEQWLRLN